MKLEIINPLPKEGLFFKLFDFLRPVITDDVIIYAKPEYLWISGMDASHAILAQLKIEKNFFDGYQVNEVVKAEVLCSPVEELEKLFKAFSKFKRVLVESSGGKLNFSSTTEKKEKKMSIPLFDTEETEPPNPVVEFKTVIQLDADDFHSEIKDALLVGNDIRLKTEGINFTMTSKNESGGSYENVWRTGEDMSVLMSEPANSEFPGDQLEEITRAGKALSNKVQISLGTGIPIKLTYIADHIVATYFEAPMLAGDQ